METNSIILIGAICIVIGFLIGQLVSGIGKENKADSTDRGGGTLLEVRPDLNNDEIMVTLEGKEFEKSFSLDRKQRAQVHKIIVELNNWLEAAPSLVSKDIHTPNPEAIPPDLEIPKDSTLRPKFSPVKMVVNALQSDVQKSKVPNESLVAQIDEVLQELLNDAAHIKDPVRLMEWPGKGIMFMVGLDKYESVDDIPDDAVRDIIRSAVKAWEEQQVEDAV